jgi:uncharacterized protein (DUF58 family)
MRRVVTEFIPIFWTSSERMPGAGERKSSYRGSGDDFDGTVEYSPGDDVRDIDWVALAASGGTDLQVNVYRQITDIKAFVLADVGMSMNFGTKRVNKRHLAAELGACCVASLEESHDRVGLVLYSGRKVERYIPSRSAAAMMYPTLTGILDTQPKGDGVGNGLAKALRALPPGRSLVFVVSDFLNVSIEDWLALKRAAKLHDVLCFVVEDIRERELPDLSSDGGFFGWLSSKLGWFYVLEDWTGARRHFWVNKTTRARYTADFKAHEAQVLKQLEDARCRALVVSTEEGADAYLKIAKALRGRK